MILKYDTIDSTNLEAKRLIKSKGLENAYLLAKTQTAGKGRFDRVWYSPEGEGIYLTAVFAPIKEIDMPHLYVILAAVASAWAVEAATKLELSVKWPNDLLLGGKKVGGILTEVVKTKNGYTPLIGIGINVNTASFPATVVKVPATSLALEAKSEFSVEKVAKQLISKIKRARLRSFDFLFSEWKKRCQDVGKKVKLTIADQVYQGAVVGWGEAGELLLRDENDKIRPFSAGEIEYLRGA